MRMLGDAHIRFWLQFYSNEKGKRAKMSGKAKDMRKVNVILHFDLLIP